MRLLKTLCTKDLYTISSSTKSCLKRAPVKTGQLERSGLTINLGKRNDFSTRDELFTKVEEGD